VSPAVRSDQADLTVADLDRVGVVGAGTMGAGIAQLALEAGHEVTLQDVDPGAFQRARQRIRDGLARRAARLDLDPDSIEAWADGRLSALRPGVTLDDLAGCDLVVEAAREDLATKRELFRRLDALTAPGAILATNTSALSVAGIAAAAGRPERVLGLHFFNPAPVMPLVEVVVALRTAPDVADRALALMEAWGKVAIRCTDTPGFIVNRVNRPFTLEPLAALEAGEASAAAIDRAARHAGYPMGPFELLDLIGLDVNLAVSTAIHDAAVAAGDPLAPRFRPSSLQAELVRAGRLGRKSGGGFLALEPAMKEGTGPDPAPDHAATAVIERTTIAIVDEAYRALGDGVATAADIDLALRLGAGHPIGPFERVDRMGGPAIVLERLRGLADRGPRFTPAPALLATASP
jgi:3-hydroxybutyryl-CoA dehydrogenase